MTDSQINGLILIDCWEPDLLFGQATKDNKRVGKTKNKFFVNLIDNLKKFNFSGTIVSSTHGISTSSIIQAYLPTYNTVNITTQTEFFELRKNNKNFKRINHWLVVGTTWQVCVHLNNMGLCGFSTMMAQHPKLNFYGVPWGFLKHDLTATTAEDFATDLLTWTNVGQMYRLHPEIIDQSTQCTQTSKFRDKYIDATPY
jgi:hypothetical protein